MWTQTGPQDEHECPRLTTASIATLTAATGEVLTGFTSLRSVNLGHGWKLHQPQVSSQLEDSPIRHASGRCRISGARPVIICTATASNRKVATALSWPPFTRSQALAARCTSRCFRRVIASNGSPAPSWDRVLTSTNAMTVPLRITRSISACRERQFLSNVRHPRSARYRSTSRSP